MTVSRIKTTVLSVALLGAVTTASVVPLSAQTYQTGGIQLTFGVVLRLEANDNRALDAVSAGNSFEAAIPLSFGLLSETRASRLALDLSGSLRDLNTPGTASSAGFETPSARLSYERTSASARFALSASLRDIDLSDGGVLDDDGLEVITGTATRRNTSLETRLDWRDDAPLGFGLLARISDIDFRRGTATDLDGSTLNDSRRRTLQASVRADLSDAARLNMTLGWSDFEEDGTPGRRETLSFGSTLTVDRPLGAVTASLDVTETLGDPRITASLGRTLAFPLGEVTAQIGATRGANGETNLTGTVDLRRDLPNGTVNLGLTRGVSDSDDTDAERLSTRLNLGYLQDLTPLSSLRFNLGWSEVEDTATGTTAQNGTFSAVYNRELTQDWGLDLGYRYRYTNNDASSSARSNTIFLELRRTFVTRF